MSGRLRVLLVEDREDDALLILREIMRGGYQVEHIRVETPEAMRAALQDGTWDAVISDYSLPRFDAPGALKELKDSGLDLPFIIASGTIGEDVAVAALKAGAHDFIPKSNLRRFLPALERELREAHNRRLRRAAEKDLMFSLQMLGEVFSAAPVPMALLDTDGLVLRWNHAAESVFGWTPEEVIGKFVPYVPPEKEAECRENMGLLLRGERITGAEVVRQRKDGSPVTLILSAAPLKDPAGNIVSILDILNDVTDQRALEDQFRQAQKMEAIGRLAGGIAHDFNNVLTIIEGYSNLVLADLPPSSSSRADVEEILHAAEHAASFTRQLLAFSRKQVTQLAVLEINALITEMKRMLERIIGDNIRLRPVPSKSKHYIRADKGQLEQVIINLVVNARDATHGDGEIELRTGCFTLEAAAAEKQPDAKPGDYCVISVRDNGEGMPPEVIAHIFEPFFTTKEVGKGTGLGLSTVYGIVQQNDGFIRVESSPGQGTTFSVYLPEVKPADAAQEAEPPKSAVKPSSQPTCCVLVVEDEAAVRQVIVRILGRAGYQAIETADPAEALAVIDRGQPVDLVLTDFMLPGMNGQQLARIVRERRPDLPILFMSGYTEDQMSIDPGIPYLEKPFTPTALLSKLTETLASQYGQ